MSLEPVRGIRIRARLGWQPGAPDPSVSIALGVITYLAMMWFFSN